MRAAHGSSADLTTLLLEWSQGDPDALQRLMPLVYDECHRLAALQLRHERDDHTLTPTALVHELYLRLIDQGRADWTNRAQFFAIAGRLMRRVLVDYARQRNAAKRDSSRILVAFDPAMELSDESRLADLLAIDDALGRLAEQDPEQERIVELRFFAGLTVEEIAHVVGRSPRTVKREWRLAKAWLFRDLNPELGPDTAAKEKSPDEQDTA
ncbi:sigma-70 family RNA polymerase sigma factor [soil metagenome]